MIVPKGVKVGHRRSLSINLVERQFDEVFLCALYPDCRPLPRKEVAMHTGRPARISTAILFCVAVLLASVEAWSAEILLAPGPDGASRLKKAQPGDVFIMQEGDWPDAKIDLHVEASAEKPVVLRSKTPGKVRLTGKSRVRISGHFVVVDGLAFENPQPDDDVFSFRTDSKHLASDCVLRNCSITDASDVDSKRSSRWVSIYGTRNRVENCSFAGKPDVGATLIVWVTDVPGEHVIRRNWFGPRKPLGKNGGETIRVGTSDVSLLVNRTIVEENWFEECDGEVETISNKSCENIYRHNVFDRCSGTITLRHGNRCLVDGNMFLGQGKRGSGGVRVIGEDHRVVNNYFAGLQGDEARAALSFMNGVPNGELHEYAQVKRALVAFNTVVDCKVPLAIGITGTKTATLPPENCVIANNAFSTAKRPLIDPSGPMPGWQWVGNLQQSSDGAKPTAGVELAELRLESGPDGRLDPGKTSALIDRGKPLPEGFVVPTTDIDGRPRDGKPDVGCEEATAMPAAVIWPTRATVGPGTQR
jgi:poly(beta-D-mannuronate) lyase